jgi:hypothetical protein
LVVFEPQSDVIVSADGVTPQVISYGAYGTEGTTLEIDSPSAISSFYDSQPLTFYARLRSTGRITVVRRKVMEVIKKLGNWAS